MVLADLLCVQCDYNLRLQPIDGQCPECGAAVQRALAASRIMDYLPGWFRHSQLAIAALLAGAILLADGLVVYAFGDYLRVLFAGTPAEKSTAWGNLLILMIFGIFASAASVGGLIITLPASPVIWRRRGRLRFWLALRWLYLVSLPLGPGLMALLFVIAILGFSI